MSPVARVLSEGMARVNRAYNQIPPAKRNFPIDGPEWEKREVAINQSYKRGTPVELTAAVEEYERFATALFKAASES